MTPAPRKGALAAPPKAGRVSSTALIALSSLAVFACTACGRSAAHPTAARVAAAEHQVTTAPHHVDLAVQVRPIPGEEARIEIEVRAASDDLPRRWVLQKHWAGEEEVLEHLEAPKFTCDGNPVTAIVEDLDTHVGWSMPTSCASSVVRYATRAPRGGLEWGYEFDVVVTPALVTSIAETVLLLPDVPDETKARVDVTFDLDRMPAGTEGVYSLGPGAHETTTRTLRHAFFAVGRFQTVTETAGNLTLEARFPAVVDAKHAARDLHRLLESEAKLFSDPQPETLRLVVVGMPDGGGAHGTSLSASALLWRDAKSAWSDEDARLAAHEMFHLYNGQIIERSSGTGTDAQTYWFSEGFTEHYTDELMRRSGVWRAKEWFLAVRDRLRRYHAHPDCETPNDRADMRWGGAAVQLPYLRGSMVATYVDHAMRVRSKGARSLDDLMRKLLSRARDHAPPVDPDEMLRLIGEEAGEDTAELVRSVAIEGKRLVLPVDAFGACLEVVGTGKEQDLRIRSGVDLEACMRAGG